MITQTLVGKGSCQVKKIQKSEKNLDLSDPKYPPTRLSNIFFFEKIGNMKTTRKTHKKKKKSKKFLNPSWA